MSAPELDPDVLATLRLLAQHRVEHVVVGDAADTIHEGGGGWRPPPWEQRLADDVAQGQEVVAQVLVMVTAQMAVQSVVRAREVGREGPNEG